MTQRKPPNMSFPDWVERQIQTAQAQGAFDNLPGAGKPLRGLDRPGDGMSWVADYLRRENVDVAALLPPALALAKEVELLAESLPKQRSESQVRALVEDLNARIRRAHQRPQDGPPLRVTTVNIDDMVALWRSARASAEEAARAAITETAAQPSHTHRTRVESRRRWFRR
jgi:hypothetical protein